MSAPALACVHFGTCGGCTQLDVPIAAQLLRKRARLRELLGPWLHGIEIACDPPPRPPQHDRMKLLFPARAVDAGAGAPARLATGLYARGSHTLVPIQECAIQARALTLLATRMTAVLRDFDVSAYDETSGQGWLRALHARLAPGTGELLAGLVTRTADLPRADALVPRLLAAANDLPPATRRPVRLVGLCHNVNPAAGNVLLGTHTRTLWGRDHLFDRHDGLTFRVGFTSFYQVHRHTSAILHRPAIAMLGDVRGLRVVDGYGGVGAFSLRLAAAGAAQVDLVEQHPGACADARWGIAENRLAHIVRVHEAAFAQASLASGPGVAVVDPTRAGLGPDGVAQVLRLRPSRLLYVACGPEALARDLAGLSEEYQVCAARLCDLFPHTDHCEVAMLLQRRKA